MPEQFANADQREHSATLGMWVFLATEVLFFGGLFLAYTVYRWTYSHEFADASRDLNIGYGFVNTWVLLTSSFTMAMAVRAAQLGRRTSTVGFLLATLCLGAFFMTVKGFEYHDDFVKGLVPGAGSRFQGTDAGPRKLFLCLYYFMTGLHALHMAIGIGLLVWMTRKANARLFSVEYHTPIRLVGLYWHFVDLVWIFLFPLLYLIDRHPGGT